MQKLFIFLTTFVMIGSAQAQEFAAIAGIHSARVSDTTEDSESTLGYRFGLIAKVDLTDTVFFRSGLMYTSRQYEETNAAGTTNIDYKFAYVDVPALFQVKITDIFSIYAGPVIAINVGDKVEGQSAGLPVSYSENDMKSLYLLGQLGANFDFDGIGFDVYVERGFGDIYDNGEKDYAIFGANVMYWF